jgi:hypothetical protein
VPAAALVLALTMMLAPYRVTAGPYAGAFRYLPDGAINWYFANTALLRLPTLPPAPTRAYLDAYLNHVDPTGGIGDVIPNPLGEFAPVAPDSLDAYAATFLALASRYTVQTGDTHWFRAHADALKAIAYARLLTQLKPNGLIRANTTDATGYLMDNIEDWSGLRAFGAVLQKIHDPDAAYVGRFVRPLERAIAGLFSAADGRFFWSDSDPIGELAPYPVCAAQVFALAAQPSSGDRRVDASRFAAVRSALARCPFSLSAAPHETLQYALYLSHAAHLTSGERATLAAARAYDPPVPDLMTASLLAALHNG